MEKIYPDSGVELSPFISKNYDKLINVVSFGVYGRFIRNVIALMKIKEDDKILDLGCGTGRNSKLMLKYLGNNGRITGLDISPEMEQQFVNNFKDDERVRFINQRIDQPVAIGELYDKVFISFVIHGFPHEVRAEVIKNAYSHLKPGGMFFILDFGEFDMAGMPALYRFVFKKVECKYAFDFIGRDWKKILSGYGFDDFEEHHFMKNYVRLLKGVKKE